MLVSKSNEINTSTFINSGSCNERKSSKSMELLAYSIIKLICKEAASG
ncbi:YpjCB family protein, partial [Escherichia coli]